MGPRTSHRPPARASTPPERKPAEQRAFDMTMRRLLLFLFVCSLRWAAVHAFTIHRTKPRSIRHSRNSSDPFRRRQDHDEKHQLRSPTTTTTALLDSKKDTYYNDDAFGLILIGSSILSKDDYSFPALFAVFSAGALLSVRFCVVPNDPRLPGVVAVTSLLGSILVQGAQFSFSRELAFEAAVTCVSVVWSLIQHRRLNQ
jgi:hypothetical protein